MTHTDDARGPHHHDPAELDNVHVAHEHTDVNIRAILMFAAGLVVVAAVVHVLMALMFNWLEAQARENDPQLSPLTVQAPEMPETTTASPAFGHARGGAQLLTNEPLALQQLREAEEKRLGPTGWGWVEGKPGVAHIPIEEAKKLILERGLPVRAGEPVAPTAGTRAATLGEASGGRAIPTGTQQSATGGAPPQQPAGSPPGGGPAPDKH